MNINPNESLTDVNLVSRNVAPNGVQLVSPTQSGRIRADDLVSLAQDIQKSDAMIAAVTCGKLKLIADQIEQLRRKAYEIMEESVKSLDLNRVACNFTKVPGTIYNLYERDNGELYFSMLSIDDWNNKPPHKYLGRYLLNADRSWTDLSKGVPQHTPQLTYYPPGAKIPKLDDSQNHRMEFQYQPSEKGLVKDNKSDIKSIGLSSLSNVTESIFMET